MWRIVERNYQFSEASRFYTLVAPVNPVERKLFYLDLAVLARVECESFPELIVALLRS